MLPRGYLPRPGGTAGDTGRGDEVRLGGKPAGGKELPPCLDQAGVLVVDIVAEEPGADAVSFEGESVPFEPGGIGAENGTGLLLGSAFGTGERGGDNQPDAFSFEDGFTALIVHLRPFAEDQPEGDGPFAENGLDDVRNGTFFCGELLPEALVRKEISFEHHLLLRMGSQNAVQLSL